MKIRMNFVSNSSSSSFICWVKQEAFNSLELNPIEKALSEATFIARTREVFGSQCKVISWGEGDISIWDSYLPEEIITDKNKEAIEQFIRDKGYNPEDSDDIFDYVYDAQYTLRKKIEKLPKDTYLMHDEDF